MKSLFDFFPIVIFFIVFKINGIYLATAAFIAASFLQIAFYYYRHRRFEKMHLITFVLGVLLGSATLLLHDELFIKWKPTAIYWVLSLVFLISQYFSDKSIIQRMMETNIALPKIIWSRLNISWVIFFLLMGLANLYIIYHFSTSDWVNFKLFGTLGLTLFFVILQGIYLSRHIKTEKQN